MKNLPKEKTREFGDPLVLRMWEDIVYSMDQYTHDSVVSKFFLPEQLTVHCRHMASIFAQIHYAPLLDPEEAKRSRLYALFFLAMTCGVQIYLKEHALFTNNTPYHMKQEKGEIKTIIHNVTKSLFDGVNIHSTTEQIMEVFLKNLVTPMKLRRLEMKEKTFDLDKFQIFLPATILWGYLFAKEMLIAES